MHPLLDTEMLSEYLNYNIHIDPLQAHFGRFGKKCARPREEVGRISWEDLSHFCRAPPDAVMARGQMVKSMGR